MNIDIYWKKFLDCVNSSIEKHIPKVKPSNKAKKKPWLNKEALVSIQEKKRAWKIYTMCKTKSNFQLYAQKRHIASRTCRLAKLNFEREIALNIKSDS